MLICGSFALLVFIVSLSMFFFSLYRNRPQEQPEVSIPPDHEIPDTSPLEETPQMLDYMADLYAQNPDLVGYIHIDGTNIDGPVVYTAGEDYYLYRGFDREDHIEGCLYVDKHNTVEPRDDNLIIHGHNMNNGTMFADLLLYKDEAYYKEHGTIRYDSLYESAEYEIISVFVSQVYYVDDDVFKYYKEYNFKTEDSFHTFMENIKSLSLYDTGVSAKYGDEFITLSTCEYSREDGRMVVVARKVTNSRLANEAP